jgi:hypothetical protein
MNKGKRIVLKGINLIQYKPNQTQFFNEIPIPGV